ncbi:MAG: hypothetical protein IIZ82_06820 [Clostridia bacterium]|jgi:hypothetical protein|nr:hypothetical protein [Clostridia bacterium]MDO4834994.1 hypothetical protein [Clostridia bacterium]
MIFKKKETPVENEPVEAEAENPFVEAAEALVEMEQNGELPENFDLSEATQDRAFAELLSEFEPKAAVRIYVAEKRAEDAEKNVKTRMSEQARSRSALPKSQRSDRAVAPAPDYMSMSKEAFSALEKQYRNAAHNGKRVHI